MREYKSLNNIIKHCESISDQLSLGAKMTESDFNTLGYIEGSIRQLKEKVYKDLDFQITEDIQKVKVSK
jgi:hypothetical protein